MELQDDIRAWRPAEFADRVGIGLSKLYAEVRADRLRLVKVGRASLITAQAARDFFALLEAEAKAARSTPAAADHRHSERPDAA